MPSTRQVSRRRTLEPLHQLLRRVFNLKGFRPGQEAVLESILAGRDTLAVMPTGAGKSLCYQLPALHLPGMTIVVSPLISLMKDQVDKLTELGVDASQVNSALTTREELEALDGIAEERPEFVLTTPERITDPGFLRALRGKAIDLFVVDEAHCISQWGHDFRPAYLELGHVIAELGHPQVLALTATASREVADDIVRRLQLRDVNVINTGIYRPNLCYEVTPVEGPEIRDRLLTQFLVDTPGSGIVYTTTVKHAEAVAALIRGLGVPAERYHGRLAARTRHDIQDRFMNGDLRVIAATNAFGMGIDKPDIRYVVHYGMPGSLDAYYQESGRAGRDGAPARCLLLYHRSDRQTHTFFMAGKYPAFDDVLNVYTALERLHRAPGAPLAAVQQEATGVAKTKVRVVLALLKELDVVARHRTAGYSLTRTGLDEAGLRELTAFYETRLERDRERLDQMTAYAQTAMCRWKKLVDYYGEAVDWETCGHCDNCTRPRH